MFKSQCSKLKGLEVELYEKNVAAHAALLSITSIISKNALNMLKYAEIK